MIFFLKYSLFHPKHQFRLIKHNSYQLYINQNALGEQKILFYPNFSIFQIYIQ